MTFTVKLYRGDVPDLAALLARLAADRVPIQLLAAERVVGRAHLEHAARLAERAMCDGRAAANALPAEALRYAAAERQVARAVEKLGLSPGRDLAIAAIGFGRDAPAALAALASERGWRESDEGWGGIPALARLGVTEAEMAVVPKARWEDLALDRVALVDVLK